MNFVLPASPRAFGFLARVDRLDDGEGPRVGQHGADRPWPDVAEDDSRADDGQQHRYHHAAQWLRRHCGSARPQGRRLKPSGVLRARDAHTQRRHPRVAFSGLAWWAVQGLNLRPLPCEGRESGYS